MKLTPYAEAISRDKKEADLAAAGYRAEETQAILNLELVKLKAEIAGANSRVQKLSSAYPLDSDELLDSLDDLALLERQQAQLTVVISQLFPTA